VQHHALQANEIDHPTDDQRRIAGAASLARRVFEVVELLQILIPIDAMV
jgi:hypothetical protein